MNSLERDAVRDLWLLSLTAGSADAAGYLGLGQVFTSNMTGNVVLMGIYLGQGNFSSAGRVLYVLAFFILGTGFGAWLGRDVLEKQWRTLAIRLIGLEKILLVLFGLGWFVLVDRQHGVGAHVLLAILAMAMGLQSSAMYRLSAPGVVTTAVTGTLTALATGVMSLLLTPRLQTDQRTATRERVQFQLHVVILYGLGAAVGGWLIVHIPDGAGCFPILAAVFVGWKRLNPQ